MKNKCTLVHTLSLCTFFPHILNIRKLTFVCITYIFYLQKRKQINICFNMFALLCLLTKNLVSDFLHKVYVVLTHAVLCMICRLQRKEINYKSIYPGSYPHLSEPSATNWRSAASQLLYLAPFYPTHGITFKVKPSCIHFTKKPWLWVSWLVPLRFSNEHLSLLDQYNLRHCLFIFLSVPPF